MFCLNMITVLNKQSSIFKLLPIAIIHYKMKTIGMYQMIRQIGQGAYGNVYQARKSGSNQPLAIKMISTSHFEQRQIDLIQMEVEVLQKIDYPSIIKLLDVRRTKNNYYLVFEFCENGDLERYLRKHTEIPLKEEIVQKLIYHISDAVRELHKMNIAHRDIKLANILLTKDFVVKLSDFGFAKASNSGMLMETYCGTPMNMAPEILLRQQYSLKCDIWSLGVVLFQLAYGKLPFSPGKGKGLIDLIEIIQGFEEVVFPAKPALPDSFKKLVSSALRKNPESRISIEEFFNNEWVQAGKNTMINTSNLLRTISVTAEVYCFENEVRTQVQSEVETTAQTHVEGEAQIDFSEIINAQKSVARKLHQSIEEEIENVEKYFEQIFKQQNKLSLKQQLFEDFVTFLFFKYVKSIKTTPIKIVCKEQQFQFGLTDIQSLSSKLVLPKQSKTNYSMQTFLDLLTTIADKQKSSTKEESLRDYKIILKLFELCKRGCMTIQISGEVQTLNLMSVRKYLLEGGYGEEYKNGTILQTTYADKNSEFAYNVEKLRKLCEERIFDVESEIENKN